MRLEELKLALATTASAFILGTLFLFRKSSLKCTKSLVFSSFLNVAIHVLPIFILLFTTLSAASKKLIQLSIFGLSACISSWIFRRFYKYENTSVITMLLICAHVFLTYLELAFFVIKWVLKNRRRRILRKAPVTKRRKEKDIRTQQISVGTEVRHLRAKIDFVINGTPYIRKGETVELLKTIGSYYSVRNGTGTEYIVPKSNFF